MNMKMGIARYIYNNVFETTLIKRVFSLIECDESMSTTYIYIENAIITLREN